MDRTVQDAIQAALAGNWEEAVRLNEQIVALSPTNIDALNRLAHALYELGQWQKARKTYRAILKQDRYNTIAFRGLARLEQNNASPATRAHEPAPVPLSPGLFLEEPGITKILKLLRPASPRVLSKHSVGDPIVLCVKHRSLVITSNTGEYLGILPDELAHHLQPRIRAGNVYEAYIKSVGTKGVTVLLRETRRKGKYRTLPAFLALNDQKARALPDAPRDDLADGPGIVEDMMSSSPDY